MGVKVKLAGGREIGGVRRKAGDVVEVDPGEARALVAVNAAVRVDDKTKQVRARRAAGVERKKG